MFKGIKNAMLEAYGYKEVSEKATDFLGRVAQFNTSVTWESPVTRKHLSTDEAEVELTAIIKKVRGDREMSVEIEKEVEAYINHSIPTGESRFCQALHLVKPFWWVGGDTPFAAFDSLGPDEINTVLQIANWPTMKGMPSPGVGEDEPFFKAISRL